MFCLLVSRVASLLACGRCHLIRPYQAEASLRGGRSVRRSRPTPSKTQMSRSTLFCLSLRRTRQNPPPPTGGKCLAELIRVRSATPQGTTLWTREEIGEEVSYVVLSQLYLHSIPNALLTRSNTIRKMPPFMADACAPAPSVPSVSPASPAVCTTGSKSPQRRSSPA